MYAITAVPFQLLLIQGVAGISSLLLCVMLVSLGVITWFQPHLRTVTGITIIVLSLASVLLTNLGGFIVGMLLGLHGGASIAGWTPREKPARRSPQPPQVQFPIPPPVTSAKARTTSVAHLLDPPAQASSAPATPADPDVDSVPDTVRTPAVSSSSTAPDPSIAPDPTTAPDPTIDPDGGHRRAGGSIAGAGSVLLAALLVVQFAAPPRAEAASVRPPTASEASFICTLAPWLCPPDKRPSTPSGGSTTTPGPAPTAGATTAPASPSPSTGIPLPNIPIPGLGPKTPAATAAPADAAARCRSGQRSGLRSLLPSVAAQLMGDCATAQNLGTLINDKKASSAGAPQGAAMPLRLQATKQTLTGLAYDGITTLQTASGPKQVLKLRASSIKIEGLKQTVTYPGGTMTLTADTATISGNINLYVLKQSGSAFGILPLTLSPSFPPPLVLPDMMFTNVDQSVALIQADSMTVPSVMITSA
jgi:hypothetical protein